MQTSGMAKRQCVALLLVCLVNLTVAEDVTTSINLLAPKHTVTAEYVSYNMDSYIFSTGWMTFNFSSPRLHTLLSGLSPALFRVGGSPADWLLFDAPLDKLNASGVRPPLITMSKYDWDKMVAITRQTGLRLLFDLNLQLRYGRQWDPSNAITLMEYSAARGYGDNLDWELGNEPTDYSHPIQTTISGSQVGADFNSLRRLVNTFPNFQKSRVVGPDLVGLPGGASEKFAKGYIKACGKNIDAFTFHHYYFRGDIAHLKDYLDPHHFSNLEKTINVVKKIITNSSTPDLPYWIGETADSWHSGTANVSDRFASGFLWLEKLGLSAQMGVGVVMRQTFYGHNYGLIDMQLNPNPDYWVSYLHKQLAGTRVLDVTLTGAPSTLRVYAHCTPHSAGYTSGAVTGFALNVNVNSSILHFSSELSSQQVHIYLLTAPSGDLTSKFVNLNGQKLQLISDTTFPRLKPVFQSAETGVKVPGLSLIFFVFPSASAKACM